MKNITILNKDLCTGCGACFNICPFNAIKMEHNDEGFLYPIIDKEKCTNCGKCAKACPSIDYKLANEKASVSYAMMANDKIREKSSSGGIFTLLAELIINEGGYVVGASFSDDFKSVKHIIVNSLNELEKLKKYKKDDKVGYIEIYSDNILLTTENIYVSKGNCKEGNGKKMTFLEKLWEWIKFW